MSERSPITTHVLDTTIGRPVANVPVSLDFQASPQEWKSLGKGTTNADGRIETLLPPKSPLKKGVYRLTFAGLKGFFPEVSVQFAVAAGEEHYHVPLLFSGFGYSTYRGS